jgi:hypothetical protein
MCFLWTGSLTRSCVAQPPSAVRSREAHSRGRLCHIVGPATAPTEARGHEKMRADQSTHPVSPHINRRERLMRRLAAGISLFYALNVIVPWRPQFTGDVDDSWIYPLHLAFANGWQFGRDIAFTYGPWGFLTAGFAPQTIGTLLITWILATAVLWWNAWELSSGLNWKPWPRALAVMLLFGVIAQTDLRPIAPALLLLFVHLADCSDRFALARKWSLVLLVALISLAKFTFLGLALPIVVLVSIDEALRRRIPWTLIAYIVGIALFWLLAGQSPGGFVPFVKRSVELSRRYSDAMSLYGQTGDHSLAWFIVLALCVTLWAALATGKIGRRQTIITVLALLAAFAALFKIGYVRRDSHLIVTAGFPLFLVLLISIALWSRMQRSLRIVAGVLIVAGIWLGDSVRSVYWATSLERGLISTIVAIPSNLAAAMIHLSGSPSPQSIFEAVAHPLPALPNAGKVDFYPTATLDDIAGDWTFSKRPVWESYAAMTPALLALNADHLLGESAPDTILFKIDPIDHRFPALDDSLSWPELLTRYEPAGTWNDRVVLTHRATPLSWRLEPLTSISTTLESWIEIPPTDQLLWATIDVKPNARHALAETFYRPHELWMSVELTSGEVKAYRLIPDILRGGFLLSPAVESAQDFAALYAKPDSVIRSKRIQLTEQTFGGAPQFEPEIMIHLSTLKIDQK